MNLYLSFGLIMITIMPDFKILPTALLTTKIAEADVNVLSAFRSEPCVRTVPAGEPGDHDRAVPLQPRQQVRQPHQMGLRQG